MGFSIKRSEFETALLLTSYVTFNKLLNLSEPVSSTRRETNNPSRGVVVLQRCSLFLKPLGLA